VKNDKISDNNTPPTVALVSLGCPKNLVDSEVMAGYLKQAGLTFTDSPENAGVIVVNTCAFIAPAIEEAKQLLGEMTELKVLGNCRVLICAGCLPQREGAALATEFPKVDAFLGIDDVPHIAEIVGALLEGEQSRPPIAPSPAYLYDDTAPRLTATPPWSAYVKIAEGCCHACAFCTIPRIRGKLRSRQPESILKEAQTLVQRGVKELVLVAQDTTAYGRDNGADLPDLLQALAALPGLHWIRLMYSYPGEISRKLLETIAGAEKICHYLDLPLQHAHPRVLQAMGRQGSAEEYLAMLRQIREIIPDIALRSSFIVGFPGESEAEFQILLDFIQAAELDRVGTFLYCREEGTPAARLEPQISEKIAEERFHRLMSTQQEISLARNLAFVGKTLEVLIEGEEGKYLVGRCYRDAPEIDGEVLVKKNAGSKDLPLGVFLPVQITEAGEYDLGGKVISQPGKNRQ
jgi:ribosomal protein S12 methylthiotransferase